jgi:hypothetical protein
MDPAVPVPDCTAAQDVDARAGTGFATLRNIVAVDLQAELGELGAALRRAHQGSGMAGAP